MLAPPLLSRTLKDAASPRGWRRGLAPVPEPDQEPLIQQRDREVADLAGVVLHPGWLVDLALLVIRARESREVRHVIDVLSEEVAHFTELVEMAREA